MTRVEGDERPFKIGGPHQSSWCSELSSPKFQLGLQKLSVLHLIFEPFFFFFEKQTPLSKKRKIERVEKKTTKGGIKCVVRVLKLVRGTFFFFFGGGVKEFTLLCFFPVHLTYTKLRTKSTKFKVFSGASSDFFFFFCTSLLLSGLSLFSSTILDLLQHGL